MKIHKEGFGIIFMTVVICSIIETLVLFFGLNSWANLSLITLSLIPLGIFVLVVQFFRLPSRKNNYEDGIVLCPADGKVVVIEEVEETEYFNDRRIQISIFMSPLNVHANFNPVSGVVQYAKYHPGKFLVAWHPKSSTDNERTTFVTKTASGKEVLFRQIAGALARRICYYVKSGQNVEGGQEFGFIKFGSRIDLFLPLDANISVQLNQKVKGQLTKIADL
jgi:phosphatidylserine decarboxylase